jgi:hypothetical protein
MDLNPAPYRGDAGIPHVSEEVCKMAFFASNVRNNYASPRVHVYQACLLQRFEDHFICASAMLVVWCDLTMFSLQLALVALSLPGRVFGSEIRPRKFS